MPTREPYSGTQRKLVLAFDVGTTYSGISYSILDPGLVPQVRGVTRYPAQAHVGGDSKIPSILWYDAQGTARAMGAEALQDSIRETADDENWVMTLWWKLHLRPKSLGSSQPADNDIPPLPANKRAIDVLADFMRYLHQCARSYIQETHPNGQALWASLENQTDFVLTHPNGWEGAQQSEIRRAAVLAGLVPDTDAGQSRIQLVTEGEASLHYCIWNGLTAGTMANGQGVIIVDAGGGTIDLSAYYMSSSDSFEEIAPTDCLLHGSALVTRRAGKLIAEKLRGSKYGNPESIADIAGCFDKTTKLRFRNPNEPSYIRFGSLQDKDPDFNIKSGQLKLPGSEVEALFEPSIQAIINAIEAQRRAARQTISSIFLVGGFAASDWLFKKLEEYFLPRKITFSRPDGHANKAVADGAISFYLDHRVSARVARWTYGIPYSPWYDPAKPDHVTRANNLTAMPSGGRIVPNGFSIIIAKGTKVSEDKEFRSDYLFEHKDLASCNSITSNITCYRGYKQNPEWMDIEPAMYPTLCTVTANTSQMAKGLTASYGSGGGVFWRQNFSIVLLFGLTELKAQISWIEGGRELRSPAKVIYDRV